jgi:hypothetical protein
MVKVYPRPYGINESNDCVWGFKSKRRGWKLMHMHSILENVLENAYCAIR